MCFKRPRCTHLPTLRSRIQYDGIPAMGGQSSGKVGKYRALSYLSFYNGALRKKITNRERNGKGAL